jgi:hypothetical protein
MREYFGTLLCVAAVCGFAESLAPEGKDGGLSKQIKLICALCVLSVIVLPITNLLGDLRDGKLDELLSFDAANAVFEYEEVFEEYIKEQNELGLSEGLESFICDEFLIDDDDIYVDADIVTENEKYRIGGVRVYISGKAIAKDPKKIIECVEKKTSSECEIIYKQTDKK